MSLQKEVGTVEVDRGVRRKMVKADMVNKAEGGRHILAV